MELKPEQRKKAEEKLSKLLPGMRCSVCQGQGTGWLINNKLFELREFNGGNLALGQTSVFPVLLVVCKGCGNTLMFNALELQLLEKDDAGEK